MNTTIIQKVKDNPVISTLTILAIVGGSITGGLGGLKVLDDLVVTQAELDQHAATLHVGADQAIDELKAWNRCDRLERRLEELANRKWRLEHPPEGDDIDDDAVRDVMRDIEATERQYGALRCAQILAG